MGVTRTGAMFGTIFGAAVFALGLGAPQPAVAQLNAMSCITLSELRAGDTPPRLARSVRDCIAQERYADAMRLFLAYSTFGTFDQQRVRDESGHAAFTELNSWIFGGYPGSVIDQLRAVSARLRVADGAFFVATCAAIRAAGWPTYRPAYMIDRAMLPHKSDDDWVSDGFVAAVAWETALVEVNGCPAGWSAVQKFQKRVGRGPAVPPGQTYHRFACPRTGFSANRTVTTDSPKDLP